jgi:hypothetical protein
MNALAAFGIAAAAATLLVPAASAQMRVVTEHAATAAALQCLLAHRHEGCGQDFVGSARRPATFWLWWTATKDLDLGPLVSSEYAGTQSVNAYTTKHLSGRVADVYDVKFAHQEKSFYIARPGADGKVQYLWVRNGAPDDEKMEH